MFFEPPGGNPPHPPITPRDRHVVLHPFTFDAADVPLRSFTSLTHARKLRIDAIVYQCQRLELVGVRDLGEDEMGGFLLVDWWKYIYIYIYILKMLLNLESWRDVDFLHLDIELFFWKKMIPEKILVRIFKGKI